MRHLPKYKKIKKLVKIRIIFQVHDSDPHEKNSIIIMVRDKGTWMIGWGSKEVKVNFRVELTYMIIIYVLPPL